MPMVLRAFYCFTIITSSIYTSLSITVLLSYNETAFNTAVFVFPHYLYVNYTPHVFPDDTPMKRFTCVYRFYEPKLSTPHVRVTSSCNVVTMGGSYTNGGLSASLRLYRQKHPVVYCLSHCVNFLISFVVKVFKFRFKFSYFAWASWRLKSPTTWLFAQQIVQTNRKYNIKAPHY